VPGSFSVPSTNILILKKKKKRQQKSGRETLGKRKGRRRGEIVREGLSMIKMPYACIKMSQ
jgi:hypothetical protein